MIIVQILMIIAWIVLGAYLLSDKKFSPSRTNFFILLFLVIVYQVVRVLEMVY